MSWRSMMLRNRPTRTDRKPAAASEPIGTTIADIAALVAGFAIVMIIPWFGFQPGQVAWLPAGERWNWLYTVSGTLVEGVERLCLVLTFVIFARRVRYGGIARAAEFLIALVALHLLITPRAGMMDAMGLASWHGRYGTLIVVLLSATSIVSIACLLVANRRLPGYFKTIILLVATLTFEVLQRGNEDLERWLAPNINRYVVDGLMIAASIPGLLLFTIPFSAALVLRPSKSWIEWSGLALAFFWFLLNQIHYLSSAFLSDPVTEFLGSLVESWVLWIVAFLLSLFLVRRFGPAWKRWIEPRMDAGFPVPQPVVVAQEFLASSS